MFMSQVWYFHPVSKIDIGPLVSRPKCMLSLGMPNQKTIDAEKTRVVMALPGTERPLARQIGFYTPGDPVCTLRARFLLLLCPSPFSPRLLQLTDTWLT